MVKQTTYCPLTLFVFLSLFHFAFFSLVNETRDLLPILQTANISPRQFPAVRYVRACGVLCCKLHVYMVSAYLYA